MQIWDAVVRVRVRQKRKPPGSFLVFYLCNVLTILQPLFQAGFLWRLVRSSSDEDALFKVLGQGRGGGDRKIGEVRENRKRRSLNRSGSSNTCTKAHRDNFITRQGGR